MSDIQIPALGLAALVGIGVVGAVVTLVTNVVVVRIGLRVICNVWAIIAWSRNAVSVNVDGVAVANVADAV